MEKLFFAIAVAVLGVGPLMLLVHRQRKRRRAVARSPFTDKLLRPAGESLRLKLSELTDKLSDYISLYLLTAVFTPFLLFLSVPITSLWTGASVLLVVEAPILIFYGRKIFKLRRQCSNYELGFQGERAVGEELNQLLADGCWVYHDLPCSGKLGEFFNIDHIILSPMGVFAIETKTRRKAVDIPGQDGSRISFNGYTAVMPWGESAFGIEQVKRNAAYLADWLSKATGERIPAFPILTFPGWFIDITGKGEVTVLNPKQIRHAVLPHGQRTSSPPGKSKSSNTNSSKNAATSSSTKTTKREPVTQR